MGNLVIQTNVMALNSHRNLKVVGGKQMQSSARLSSGYRINSAADDASGLAISEKMRAQIRGLDMASKNTQDGISLVQTAEGGMQEIDNMVQRIRELVVQAANDTNDYVTADRKKLQDEIDQLTQGIDAMAGQVEFNAKKLLDGSLMDSATKGSLMADLKTKFMNAVGISVGASSAVSQVAATLDAGRGALGVILSEANNSKAVSDQTSMAYTVTVTAGGATKALGMTASAATGMGNYTYGNNGNVGTANVSSADAVRDYVGWVDDYISKLQDVKKSGGAPATAAENLMANLAYNRQAALDLYAGVELMSAISKSYQSLDKTTAGNGLWFQTGANSVQGINVGIGKVTSNILGIGKGNGISTVKVDKANALEVSAQIDIVDNALQYVTSQRAKLGAVQNRLEFTKSSLDISSENLSASESRIRDTDMAKEMMKLTAANVLQQAGVSMLAQANQNPQSVLALLR